MELNQKFVDEIRKIVEEFSKPRGTGSVLWYRLSGFRAGEHQSDMNKLAGCLYPKIDALCLILPTDYLFDWCTLVIVYEHSELAKQEHFQEKWHDEISMTNFKKTKIRDLLYEDFKQTTTIIECNANYNFHVWRSPRRIKAVTDNCKDFGDIWRNGVCIHEGNKYGDHEHFYVIGSIHREKTQP